MYLFIFYFNFIIIIYLFIFDLVVKYDHDMKFPEIHSITGLNVVIGLYSLLLQ